MRRARSLFERRFSRADIEVPVDLHAVGAHDLAAEALGERDGELGLAGRGRPDDHDQGRLAEIAHGRRKLGGSFSVVKPSPRLSARKVDPCRALWFG